MIFHRDVHFRKAVVSGVFRDKHFSKLSDNCALMTCQQAGNISNFFPRTPLLHPQVLTPMSSLFHCVLQTSQSLWFQIPMEPWIMWERCFGMVGLRIVKSLIRSVYSLKSQSIWAGPYREMIVIELIDTVLEWLFPSHKLVMDTLQWRIELRNEVWVEAKWPPERETIQAMITSFFYNPTLVCGVSLFILLPFLQYFLRRLQKRFNAYVPLSPYSIPNFRRQDYSEICGITTVFSFLIFGNLVQSWLTSILSSTDVVGFSVFNFAQVSISLRNVSW